MEQMPHTLPEFFFYLLVAACMIIGWFTVRTLNQVSKNQTKLFERMDEQERKLSSLIGEHNAYTRRGIHDKD